MRNIALGRGSTTRPSTSMAPSFFAIISAILLSVRSLCAAVAAGSATSSTVGAAFASTTKREPVVGNSEKFQDLGHARAGANAAPFFHNTGSIAAGQKSVLPRRRLRPDARYGGKVREEAYKTFASTQPFATQPRGAYLSLMSGPVIQPRKPVIISVDDDPAVSRAVARDLRRRYGENYRIMRAESGASALEALKELKVRGDTVAVFVADYRMPQMSGIEFLEAAMALYAVARRVLLTAYADTHAAIEAINVVDLDYYLLKPWDPPEEKLYPVIDDQLDAWRTTGDRPIPHTKVIGHPFSAR